MKDRTLAKILEHFPDLFDELDQRCASLLSLSLAQYEEMLRSIEFRIQNGIWPEEKTLDINPDMCYTLMHDLTCIPFEDMRDCWEDLSYPEEPATFCAFELSGKRVRDMYLRNVIALLTELQIEKGDSHEQTPNTGEAQNPC